MDLEFQGMDGLGRLIDFVPAWIDGPALELVGEAIAEDASLRLRMDETAPDGSPWQPWSESYALTRSTQHKLLEDSGDLSESLSVDMRGASFELTSELPYALVHQLGSRDGTIKARPYAGLSDELDVALSDILAADFDRGAARV
jgi:phage gpG-like protein